MHQPTLMPLADPEWIEVLRAEAAKPKRTKQEIGDELGVSRTAISLLCSGKYSAKMDKVGKKIAGKVMALYANRVWCPHLRAPISLDDCSAHRSAPMTMSDPTKLKHWVACRSCVLNPDSNESEALNAV